MIFIIKRLLFFRIFQFWARYGQKTRFSAKFWIAYISGFGGDQVQKSNHRCNLVQIFCRYQGKIEKTHVEGQKKYSLFLVFFKKFQRKFFFSKNPENFIIKIIFCPRFVLYKLFCYSKQKKVIGKKWVFQNGQNRPFGGPWAGPTGPKSQKRPVSAGIRVKSTS